jgi:hypothetical protein
VSFLNPLFLFGILAAAIPIVIHLFTRRRPREIPFPSLEFLAEVNQSEIRRLKLKQWLLLLLRTLAVIAIALAMSRPALKGSSGARSGAATTVVVLVDRSGSMGAVSRQGNLVAEARRAAEALLATLGPQDELLLVPYDEAPRPFSPQPISDLGRLRAATQGLEPSARATDHRLAIATAARALEESHALNRELFWISDFQAAGFARDGQPEGPGTLAGPWSRSRVYLIPLAPTQRANVGLDDAALAPAEENAALSVSAQAFGANPGDLSVAVRDAADGADLGRGFLAIPARGAASTLVPLARTPEQGGTANLPDDALALDNRRFFASGRAGALRVLLREDAPSALRMALTAGSPASGLVVEPVDAASLPERIGEADVVVVNDVEGLAPVELQALLDFWRGGGGVLLAFGRTARAEAWNATVLEPLGLGRLADLETSAAGSSWRLRRAAAAHPVLAGFPARAGEAFSSAQFQVIRGLRAAAGARVLLEFDRGHAALIEGAHALALAAPLDPEASDFPVSGAFLPLLHQAVKVLGRGTAAASLLPGQAYAAPATTGAWRIEDQGGRQLASELVSEAGATRLRSAPLERPGLYRVLQGPTLRSTFAVNPDPRESDLTPTPEAALVRAFPAGRAQVLRPGGDLVRRVREARYGRELWGEFVALALLLLIAETIVGRWGMGGAAPAAAAKR